MDNVLKSGDQAIFMPAFGPAMVTVMPGIITGSAATVMVGGSPACVDGDERSVQVPGCAYISGAFVTPGVGTLSIQALGADQKSRKTKAAGKFILLKGMMFTAKFQVTVPAQQPTPGGPVPDPVPMYTGQGQFQTTNFTVFDKG